ncbi:hypothetical protein BCR44DRAFT_159647 [Catenaria anguillulae PL171]|uniref:Translation initiation factor eIF2B subunit delta n=1 Tax=Catenaria anguillulae PL171 TaxID=765915 RepID=A0A1Y2H566_9FUNG|nr:hypothetical protein BCR44DRAFT_159647 [Catenaria anguillulae PL171]
MTKAERRAFQEAQRAHKAAASAASSGSAKPKPAGAAAAASTSAPGQQQSSNAASAAAAATSTAGNSVDKPSTPGGAAAGSLASLAATTSSSHSSTSKTLSLFSHLPAPLTERTKPLHSLPTRSTLHPAVLTLGLQLADPSTSLLYGANARARAMLDAFKALIADYSTPPDAVLSRHLTQLLGTHISYLSDIRPLTPGMGSAIRQLKHDISVLSPDMPDHEAKEHLLDRIDTFIQERITLALTGLAQNAAPKIKDGDVILTYAHSSAVRHVLLTAHKQGRKFETIVVDARPTSEGRDLARLLIAEGVPTTYVLISGLGYAMREATKVLLGANGMLANGALLARIGSAQVALMASRKNVPVIVACETYKFTNGIMVDSIVFNELGDPRMVVDEAEGKVKGLNLLFDVTPPEFLTVVITELGLVPVTSVPVVLREYKPLLEQS